VSNVFQIAIAALGEMPSPNVCKQALEFIDELMKCCPRPLTLMLGGYWGLMKVVVDHVIEKYSDVNIILFLPLEREDVKVPKKVIRIKTGLTFKARSIPLVRSADVLVVLGGASGTILEAIAAYAQGIPVVILTGTGLPSDILERAYPLGFDHRRLAEVIFASKPKDAAKHVCRLLSRRSII